MDVERKIELVMRKPTEEILTVADLREIFNNYSHPRHYIGFEISGLVHLGTGLMTMLKIQDFIEAGIRPTIFLADYHAWINGKLGGDLEKIQSVATGYFKHAFISLGLEESKVEYILASQIYDGDYWKTVLDISRHTTIARMLRCITIMGRKEKEITSAAATLYPAMQAADIYKLNIQLAHAGMDQRKVHVLARELTQKLKRRPFAAVHSHLISGLQGSVRMDATKPLSDEEMLDRKMSKSKPETCIFIHDSEEQIKKKIRGAYCPEKIVDGNPVIEMAEYIILRDRPLKVERPATFGGDVEFATAEELKKTYSDGRLHPLDLKNAVARELALILKPSRDYFARNKKYLEQWNQLEITR